MYGSQLSFEVAVNNQRERHNDFMKNLSYEKKSKSKLAVWISLVLLTISISTVSMAGPKEGKLAGGNGNVKGR